MVPSLSDSYRHFTYHPEGRLSCVGPSMRNNQTLGASVHGPRLIVSNKLIPTMPPVQQSAPKWELMLSLDLESSNPIHRNLYALMKSEAVNVYDELLKGRRGALKPQFTSAPEPWSSNQFLDSALRHAIETMIARASPRTRPLYAKAPLNGDNWVAKWMLYHVCRYRDSRNTRCRSTNYHDDDVFFKKNASGSSGSNSSSSSTAGSKSGYYDAARNSYRPL